MTREEMLKRLKAGEDPLDLSIEKWVDIVEHLNKISSLEEFDKEIEMGAHNCALCETYFDGSCAQCPVNEVSGKAECQGTPYEKFKIAEDLEGMRKAAIAEVEFLKSLKKILKNREIDISEII